MAYPQRHFQQPPSGSFYSSRQPPYVDQQQQQQYAAKQHTYQHNPQNHNHYEWPIQEISSHPDRRSPGTRNLGPHYDNPQRPEQNAEWPPETQQLSTNLGDYGQSTPYQMRPYQGPYEDQRYEQNHIGRPSADTAYYGHHDSSWSGRSPQMPRQRQEFHQPQGQGLEGPPMDGYDGAGFRPRMNGNHVTDEVGKLNSNNDRRYQTTLPPQNPHRPFNQHQRSWPTQDVGTENAGRDKSRRAMQEGKQGSNPPSGRPQKPTKDRIPMDIKSPVTISWDNPFPAFPKGNKNLIRSGKEDFNNSMAEMSINSKSNSRQAESSKPSAAKIQAGSESLRNGGQSFPRKNPQETVVHDDGLPLEREPIGGRMAPGARCVDKSIQQPFNHFGIPPEGNRPQTDHGRYSEDTSRDYALRHPGAFQGDYQRSKTMPNTISEVMMHSHPPFPHSRQTPTQDTQRRLVNEQTSREWVGPPPQSHVPGAPNQPRSQSTENGFVRQYQDAEQWAPYPHPQHSQQSSLGDFFDSYYHSPHHSDPNFAQRHVGHSRIAPDEDMPNFDNMPETRASHRRGLTIDDHLHPQQKAPPMPPMPSQLAAFDRSPPLPRSKEGFTHSKSSPNLREQHTQRTQQYSDGFDFDLPGSVPAMYPPDPPPSRDNNEGINLKNEPYQRPWRENAVELPSPVSAHSAQGSSRSGVSESRRGQPDGRNRPPMSTKTPSNEIPGHGFRNGPSPIGRFDFASPPSGPQGNPDALPAHPPPVRAGLLQSLPVNQPSRPPPVRQYSGGLSSHPQASSNPRPQISRPPQEKRESIAVTHEGLERLRQTTRKNPSDNKAQLLLAKKLVEAASVLADDGGRADARTMSKNREKFNSEAYKLVKKLAQNGYPEAMFYLGDCYTRGLLGLVSDTKEAFGQYQSAAKAGHAQAAYRVAVCCEMGLEEGGGTKRDAVKAMQWYHRAATLGDTPAMYKMGVIQLKGLLGQPKNAQGALSWLQRAAEQADKENPHALHELALLYESPSSIAGVTKDEEHAKQLFIEAANLGYKFSEFRLGCAFEYGLLGCPIDPRQSIAWYSKAAVQDEHQSELALSGWYLTGSEGVLQQSDTEAYLWARKAAQAGLAKAEYAMGYFTEVGIGAPANIEDAKPQNFPKARERLEDLRRGGAKMQKTRVSRSKINKQSEGECILM
ncbi:MAG: hypothetical protein Q9209_001602 [Squamulea sp. 1 TL-2023]